MKKIIKFILAIAGIALIIEAHARPVTTVTFFNASRYNITVQGNGAPVRIASRQAARVSGESLFKIRSTPASINFRLYDENLGNDASIEPISLGMSEGRVALKLHKERGNRTCCFRVDVGIMPGLLNNNVKSITIDQMMSESPETGNQAAEAISEIKSMK